MLSLASYNIHSCIGGDGQLNPGRVAEVIRQTGADIAALQEVDARHRAGTYLDQWAFLADAMGGECVPGISLRTHRNIFGNALLTRHPIRAVRLHDISVNRREPRGVIDADILVNGRSLRIIATHFGLHSKERRMQADLLLAILTLPVSDTEPPTDGTILLGDFNEWRRDLRNLDKLARQFHPSPAPPTFPARYPMLPLDRILVQGDLRLNGLRAHRSAIARMASDHLPICAVVSWEQPRITS